MSEQARPPGRLILLDGDAPAPARARVARPPRQYGRCAGLEGDSDGELLRRMETAGVDVFLTADRKMEYQQRLSGRSFGVVVIAAGGTKLEDLHSIADALRDAVATVAPGDVFHLGQ